MSVTDQTTRSKNEPVVRVIQEFEGYTETSETTIVVLPHGNGAPLRLSSGAAERLAIGLSWAVKVVDGV